MPTGGTTERTTPRRAELPSSFLAGCVVGVPWRSRSARRNDERGGLTALLFTAYVAVLLAVVIPPLWIVLLAIPPGGLPARLLRWSARWVIRASGCRLRLHGVDRTADPPPVVVAANHGSYLDSIVLMVTLPADYLFVVNHEFASLPFFALAVRKARHLVVDRTSAARRRACVLEMIAALRRGRSLVVFPEGRRHRGPEMLPFRLGAFRAALEAGRPIVPVTLIGTRDIWPPDSWILHPGGVDIVVHEAIAPEREGRGETLRMRGRVRAAIEKSLQ
jgi:fatty-acyl-CoA synthase